MVETSLSHVACDLVAAGAGVSLVDPLTALSFQDKGLRVLPFFPPAIRFDTTSFVPHRCRPPLLHPALASSPIEGRNRRILGAGRRD